MNYLKAFIAGLAFPATLLPVVYAVLYSAKFAPVINEPLQFGPMLIPITFGLWNVLYFTTFKPMLGKNKSARLWIAGIALGLIIALIGVFKLDLPQRLFNLTSGIRYLPLIVVPIVYGLIWRYIVSYLNRLLKLQD